MELFSTLTEAQLRNRMEPEKGIFIVESPKVIRVALGIYAVLLTTNSCDPLNRRAVRVSMGSVFLVPWTWIDSDLTPLHDLGFKTLAMALTDNSLPLDAPILKQEERLAIIMGTEGDGLPKETIAEADYVVRIPMAHGVDSLNVAAASAIAFWELTRK